MLDWISLWVTWNLKKLLHFKLIIFCFSLFLFRVFFASSYTKKNNFNTFFRPKGLRFGILCDSHSFLKDNYGMFSILWNFLLKPKYMSIWILWRCWWNRVCIMYTFVLNLWDWNNHLWLQHLAFVLFGFIFAMEIEL